MESSLALLICVESSCELEVTRFDWSKKTVLNWSPEEEEKTWFSLASFVLSRWELILAKTCVLPECEQELFKMMCKYPFGGDGALLVVGDFAEGGMENLAIWAALSAGGRARGYLYRMSSVGTVGGRVCWKSVGKCMKCKSCVLR